MQANYCLFRPVWPSLIHPLFEWHSHWPTSFEAFHLIWFLSFCCQIGTSRPDWLVQSSKWPFRFAYPHCYLCRLASDNQWGKVIYIWYYHLYSSTGLHPRLYIAHDLFSIVHYQLTADNQWGNPVRRRSNVGPTTTRFQLVEIFLYN